MLEVAIDRDSVHAGDDLGSHATSITLDPSATLRALIEVIQDAGYLPGINGGKATWIICSSDKPIGVLAQQWPEPQIRSFRISRPEKSHHHDFRIGGGHFCRSMRFR